MVKKDFAEPDARPARYFVLPAWTRAGFGEGGGGAPSNKCVKVLQCKYGQQRRQANGNKPVIDFTPVVKQTAGQIPGAGRLITKVREYAPPPSPRGVT